MRHWIGIALIAACCGIAGAKDLGDEAAFWKATKALSPAPFVSNENCYSNPLWLLSCVNAIDAAGALLSPPVRIDTSGDQLQLRRGFENAVGSTWRAVYQARRAQANSRFWQVQRHFALAQREYGAQFNFTGALMALAWERPGDVPLQMMIGHAINGHFQTYDAHAYVIPRAQLDSRQAHSKKSFVGVGINLDFLRQGVLVHQVFAGSPATRAGLQEEDQIIAIAADGLHFQNADESEPEAFYDLLSGPDDSVVRMKVRRARDGALTTLAIRRGPVNIPNVESRLVGDGRTGYLVLRDFESLETCSDVNQHLNLLQKLGATRLIFDLRGNPGGGEQNAVCIAALFVGEQPVVARQAIELPIPSLPNLLTLASTRSAEPRRQAITWQRGGSPPIWLRPVVVLIDALSASASEIVAGAIQALQPDAWLVGERTAGKGTVQMLSTPVGNDTVQMARTVARFYLPDGRSNQVVGVMPNFEVPRRRGASAEDRFYPREIDFFPNTLYPIDRQPWIDPRADQVARIAACVRPASNESDHQMAYALGILNCL